MIGQGVEVGGVFEDGIVADGPVKGGLVEAGLGDSKIIDHHLQRVTCLLLPVNRLYQPEQQAAGQAGALPDLPNMDHALPLAVLVIGVISKRSYCSLCGFV